ACLERRVDERTWRERTHATGVRPTILVEDALVILRRADRNRARAVRNAEERHFRSLQALFDHQTIARGAELPIAHRVDNRALRRGAIVGDDDAFAGRQAVGLEHDRQAEFSAAQRRERGVRRLARAEARGRHRVARHERFRERLARLEARRRGARPEEQPAVARKAIGDAEAQRQLRADEREIDLLAFGQRGERGDVADIDRRRARETRNSGGARRGQALAGIAGGGKPRNERGLARAAADGENPHYRNYLG